MKCFKFTLAAIMAMATYTFAAETLADAFKQGSYNGEFIVMHTRGNNSNAVAAGGTSNKNTASIAVHLNYLTDDFRGFKMGISFESAHDFQTHEKDFNGPGSEDETLNTISTTNLHELFLEYSFSKSKIKVGRQELFSPLILNFEIFPLIDSFDAVSFSTADLPNTFINLMYIKEWRKSFGSDSDGSAEQENVHYDKPLYSIYIRNTSMKNLVLDAQYMTTDQKGDNGDYPFNQVDGYSEYFVRSSYTLPTEFPLVLGALYGGAHFDNTTAINKNDCTNLFGLKLSTNIKDIAMSIAYSSVSDDADFPGSLGQAPDTILYTYTGMLITHANYAGMQVGAIEASYNFGIPNLKSTIKYAHFDQSSKGEYNSAKSGSFNSADEINLDLTYNFLGTLKGLSLRTYTGYAKYDQDVDSDYNFYGRFYVIYSF